MTLKKAIVLFSGGLDSTTLLASLLADGWDCHALSFNYGQRHVYELSAAEQVASSYNCSHSVLDCKMPLIAEQGSALLDHSRSLQATDQCGPVVSSYVPARNAIFLAYALSVAEQLNSSDIFVGANKDDWEHYPDCRPEFYSAYSDMARLAGHNSAIKIHAPFCQLSKPEIIKLAADLNVDFAATISCYAATSKANACGQCDACKLRANSFKAAKMHDTLA